jgi:hypothetical protein
MSLGKNFDDYEGLPCTYVVAEKNNNATNKADFGICFLTKKEIGAISKELVDLKFPYERTDLPTREEDLQYIRDVEGQLLEEENGKFGGTLISYTVQKSTKNGAQAGQKVVIYLHSQEILNSKNPMWVQSAIAFALSLGLGKRVHFQKYATEGWNDEKVLWGAYSTQNAAFKVGLLWDEFFDREVNGAENSLKEQQQMLMDKQGGFGYEKTSGKRNL